MSSPSAEEESSVPLSGFSDHDAFADFYHRTAAALHGYVTKVTRDRAAADDILQMAYLRLLRAPRMDDAHRRAYLYRTASSIMVDRWRKLGSERRHLASQPSIESYNVHHERTMDLHHLLNEQLNGRERALLWLAYAEGFSHEEIAKILGLAEKSVKVMLFRVREKAKRLLSSPMGGEIEHE